MFLINNCLCIQRILSSYIYTVPLHREHLMFFFAIARACSLHSTTRRTILCVYVRLSQFCGAENEGEGTWRCNRKNVKYLLYIQYTYIMHNVWVRQATAADTSGLPNKNPRRWRRHFYETTWTMNAYFFLFQDDLAGQSLLDVVFARLNLIETAYFGLRYLDEENQTVSNINCDRRQTKARTTFWYCVAALHMIYLIEKISLFISACLSICI